MKFVVYQHRSKENVKIQVLTPIHDPDSRILEAMDIPIPEKIVGNQ